MVIVNIKVKGFINRIREKFLKFDSEVFGNGVEAPSALSHGPNIHFTGGQNTLVNRLETKIHVHLRVRFDGDEPLAKFLRNGEVELDLTVRSGAVHKLVNAHRVRRVDEFAHGYRAELR